MFWIFFSILNVVIPCIEGASLRNARSSLPWAEPGLLSTALAPRFPMSSQSCDCEDSSGYLLPAEWGVLTQDWTPFPDSAPRAPGKCPAVGREPVVLETVFRGPDFHPLVLLTGCWMSPWTDSFQQIDRIDLAEEICLLHWCHAYTTRSSLKFRTWDQWPLTASDLQKIYSTVAIFSDGFITKDDPYSGNVISISRAVLYSPVPTEKFFLVKYTYDNFLPF